MMLLKIRNAKLSMGKNPILNGLISSYFHLASVLLSRGAFSYGLQTLRKTLKTFFLYTRLYGSIRINAHRSAFAIYLDARRVDLDETGIYAPKIDCALWG